MVTIGAIQHRRQVHGKPVIQPEKPVIGSEDHPVSVVCALTQLDHIISTQHNFLNSHVASLGYVLREQLIERYDKPSDKKQCKLQCNLCVASKYYLVTLKSEVTPTATDPESLFNSFISSVYRLATGN